MPAAMINLDVVLRKELGLGVYIIWSAMQLPYLELRHLDVVIHSNVLFHIVEYLVIVI